MTAHEYIERWDNVPERPEHVAFIQYAHSWHLCRPGSEPDFDTPYHEWQPLPVNLRDMRDGAEKNITGDRIILNSEIGPCRLADCNGEKRTASALAHLGRIVDDYQRIGVQVVAHYNEAWWNDDMTDAEIRQHYDLIGQPERVLVKVAPLFRDTGLHRHRARFGRFARYMQVVGCGGFVQIDPGSSFDMDEWAAMLDAQKTACDYLGAEPVLWTVGPPGGINMPNGFLARVEMYRGMWA
jgi:hypothetical protein